MYFARDDYLSELVALDDAVESEPENFAVEEEGAVLKVIKVVVEADEHLIKGVGIAVVEGGIGGDAGADGVEVGVARIALHYLLDEVGALGAGAYETHIAAQDVPELGELVEMVLADELADAGEACVVLLVVELGDAGGFSIGVHGAELVDAERLAAAAYALLGEKGRAAVVAAHENVADDEEGKEYDEAEDADDDVERAFDKVLCFIVEFLAVRGEAEVSYYDERLKPILEETYGSIVYQEQIMQISMEMCGFSAGKSDVLRKAIGKKKIDIMRDLKEDWCDGAVNNNYSRDLANKIWDDVEKFAKYAFNKSHSAAYAILVMRTAYMKAHYPNEFMAAVLTSYMTKNDRLIKYIASCNYNGTPVLPPDVNVSNADFTPVDEGIRFGLVGLRGVGKELY